MTEDKYLPKGSIISKQYEVIETLGEDDFEILYLVRDTLRTGSFFVLKELFLETFSSRRGQIVYTFPEAEGVFEKRKEQIIEEIGTEKLNLNPDKIKVYGYEEDNDTIYTIMEFSSNAGLEKYLQFVPKDAEHLPTLVDLLSQEKRSSTFSFFIKALLLIGLLLGAVYAYKFFKTSKTEQKVETSLNKEYKFIDELPKKEPVLQQPIINIPVVKEENLSEVKKEENLSEVQKDENLSEVKKEENLSEVKKEENLSEVKKEENLSEVQKDENLSEVKKDENLSEVVHAKIDIKTRIKSFLDIYILASATSVDSSLKFYDKRVKRYFKFKNANHQTIENSQKRYNKKWVKRDFKISDFKIIKSYKKDNINYFDVKTTTLWTVSNKKGQELFGESRGFMTLKEMGNSFLITSLYAIK